ncbi:MAG: aminotransferase class V-fold PLP-dependent enzyme [Candidatus Saccharicenans sp.]|jgi:selenocysteine lyase/cysteine desulfurase|nr:aminotransferase class V-fold PLP-dependent enzyme [Candidatus Saccharicenans sp.]MDH7575946.1 aminotransferase class V-fold PLP-dependent enzyme [Candidatus Saccharicenans sp.]
MLEREAEEKEFWKKVRAEFLLDPGQVFFNTGTLGAMPRRVLDRVVNHLRLTAEKIAEWDYYGADWISGYQPWTEIREKIARLLNCQAGEIALTENATAGMNYISNGLDLKEGDEVLGTDQEHPGGESGWKLKAKRCGVVYRQLPLGKPIKSPREVIDTFVQAMGPRTRVLAIPHIITGSGAILPVKELCAEARQRGIFTVIDGAQTVGQIRVDLKELGCDAYYGSFHKWLCAPAGNGFLYLRRDMAGKVWTTLASTQWDNQEDHGFRLGQRGTGNLSLLFGLDEALDFHFELGPERVYARIKALGDYLRTRLQEVPGIQLFTPLHPEMAAGITVYNIEGLTGNFIQDELWKRARLRPRSMGEVYGVRQSTHIYNSFEEIDRTVDILKDLAAGR